MNVGNQKNLIAELTATSSALQQKIEDQSKEIRHLRSINQQLHQQISVLKNQNDNLQFHQQKEGSFLIELEHLRIDNQRLVTLLNGQKGDLRFLSNLETQKDKVPECLLWVPQKAYEVAHNFLQQNKDSQQLSDQSIQLLLFELNKIWAIRQFEQQKLQNSINNVEKQKILKNTAIPLQEFSQNQQIERLKQQIKDLKKENLELYANRPERGTRSIRVASAHNNRSMIK